MPGYLIAEIEVTDPEQYEEYKARVGATLEPYGARYLARGGETEVLEGDWKPRRLVILEFDSAERARQWWTSPEYAPVKAIRERSSHSRLVLAEGVE